MRAPDNALLASRPIRSEFITRSRDESAGRKEDAATREGDERVSVRPARLTRVAPTSVSPADEDCI